MTMTPEGILLVGRPLSEGQPRTQSIAGTETQGLRYNCSVPCCSYFSFSQTLLFQTNDSVSTFFAQLNKFLSQASVSYIPPILE